MLASISLERHSGGADGLSSSGGAATSSRYLNVTVAPLRRTLAASMNSGSCRGASMAMSRRAPSCAQAGRLDPASTQANATVASFSAVT
jgi:hypothetical protein